MLVQITRVLNAERLQMLREELGKAECSDGRSGAGQLARKLKGNQQLPDDHPVERKLAEVILTALRGNELFAAAALPLKMVPPMSNRNLLFELDRAIQKVARETPEQTATTDLAGVYHNLLRLWADA